MTHFFELPFGRLSSNKGWRDIALEQASSLTPGHGQLLGRGTDNSSTREEEVFRDAVDTIGNWKGVVSMEGVKRRAPRRVLGLDIFDISLIFTGN